MKPDEEWMAYPFEETDALFGDENRIRGNWSTKLDYYLSIIGFNFALGNIWRFPLRCATNGGLAYIVAYSVLFLLVPLPILFIELSLGQFSNYGAVTVWKVSPLFKGIGISMVFVSCISCLSLSMVVAWALYYMVNSFKFKLPWANCNNDWNTENCTVSDREVVESCHLLNGVVLSNGFCVSYDMIDPRLAYSSGGNGVDPTPSSNSSSVFSSPLGKVMAAFEYFQRHVLMASDTILDFDSINWQITICLLMLWLFIFLSSFKGVKSSGKIVYVTVIVPYIILFTLFVRFLTIDGALDGLYHYLMPDWTVLYDTKVWSSAGIMVFCSLSVSTGVTTVLSSYNRFHNNLLYDIWVICLIDFVTSVLVSSIVFMAAGFICSTLGISFDQFRFQDGVYSALVFFSAVLSKLPVSHLFSSVFFALVALIMFNTELFYVESLASSLCDEFPERLRRNHRHVVTFTLLSFYILSLPLCSTAGIYWIVLFESFSTIWPPIIIAFFEVVVVGWVYGADNFLNNVKWMLGCYPPGYILWKILLKFVCPLLILTLLALAWMDHYPSAYISDLPKWAIIFGWTISLSPIFIIFATAVYKFLQSNGSVSKRWRELFCPEDDWGPALAVHRAEYYPMQIPEAQKLMSFPEYYYPKQLNGTTAPIEVEQFVDRCYRPSINNRIVGAQTRVSNRLKESEKETVI